MEAAFVLLLALLLPLAGILAFRLHLLRQLVDALTERVAALERKLKEKPPPLPERVQSFIRFVNPVKAALVPAPDDWAVLVS